MTESINLGDFVDQQARQMGGIDPNAGQPAQKSFDPKNIDPSTYFVGYNDLPISTRQNLDELAFNASNLANFTGHTIGKLVSRVPEEHFRFFAQYFLGVLIPNEKDPYRVTDHNMLRNMWFNCCGSMQNDVEVYDPSGRTLFVVPAYIDSDILTSNPANMAGESFGRLRREMEAERNFPERAVDRYIEQNKLRADSLVLPIIPRERIERKARMWADIYAYYKIDPLKTAAYAEYLKSNPNSNPSKTPVQPFGFGEFGGVEEDL